jgi:hypothetical protein
MVVRVDRRANGAVMDVIGSRDIAAGLAPAHRNEKVGTITGCLAHDVSTLLGVGSTLASSRGHLNDDHGPCLSSRYERLRSTMHAPPARRISSHRLSALSSVSVPTRIW